MPAFVRIFVGWKMGKPLLVTFLRLEKKRRTKDCISAMKNEDGIIASDISRICDSRVSLYSSLFTACQCDDLIQKDLLNSVTSCVPFAQVSHCEGYLTLEEV